MNLLTSGAPMRAALRFRISLPWRAALVALALGFVVGTPLAAAPLPVGALFQEQALLSPKVSPDGTKVALIAQLEGKQFFATYDVATQQITPITRLDESRILELIWKTNEVVLLMMQNTETRLRVFRSFNLKTGDTRVHSFRADTNLMTIRHLLPQDPSSVLFSFFALSHATGVYRVELKTDKMSLEQKDPPYAGEWFISPNAATFCVLSSAKERQILQWRRVGDDAWKTIDLGPQSAPDLAPLGFHPDSVRILAKAISNKAAPPSIVALDLNTGAQELVLKSPPVQFDDALSFTPGFPVHGMSYRDGRVHPQHLDAEIARLQAGIDAVLPHTGNSILSVSTDRKVAVVLAASANHPGEYFLVDRIRGRLSSIGPQYPNLTPDPGAQLQNFSFQTREGKTLHGRILLPSGAAKPPVLIYFSGAQLPHRKLLEWDAFAQLFATRGIAFAVFDVRGTSGYGDAFREAGQSQITTGMVTDALDGLDHLVKEGVVDASRIAVLTQDNHGVTGTHFIAQEPRIKFWINVGEWLPGTAVELMTLLASGGGARGEKFDDSVSSKPAIAKISVPALHVDLLGDDKRFITGEIKKRKLPWTLIETPKGPSSAKPGKRAANSVKRYTETVERVLTFAQEQFGLATK